MPATPVHHFVYAPTKKTCRIYWCIPSLTEGSTKLLSCFTCSILKKWKPLDKTAVLRPAFKFGRRVHCALRRKMRKLPITRVPAILNGLTKLKDGLHSGRNSQVTIETGRNDFNLGQFKIRMKKMAAQVNFYLYPNAFLSSELFGAWMLAYICQIKALLTYSYHTH